MRVKCKLNVAEWVNQLGPCGVEGGVEGQGPKVKGQRSKVNGRRSRALMPGCNKKVTYT